MQLEKNQPLNYRKMNIYSFEIKDISGKSFDWETVKGKKIMVVNVASKCGLTPQYVQLEELYQKYENQGFTILGFPANNFGAQEPGTNDEIANFCEVNYGVSFPMMSKISVLGEDQHPLYKWLTEETSESVSWNFQKFLVDENGDVVESIPPAVLPYDDAILSWIASKR
jgi:glutathione peroxidase